MLKTIIALLFVPLIALSGEKENRFDFSYLNFHYDNDGANDLDRYYTFGLKASALFQTNPDGSNFLTLPLIDNRSFAHFSAFSIGQQSFTPINTRSSELQIDDRPYAGWLWAGYGLYQTGPDQSDGMEIQLGVVGPSAGGEEIMTWFHEVMGYDLPRGWQHQLNDELGIVIAYEHKWKFDIWNITETFKADLIPNIDFAFGNVHTYLNTGARIRVGWNLPDNFGMSSIKPASESNLPFSSGKEEKINNFRFYVFGLAQVRGVLRNIFLDGNTFSDSHRVDKNPFVAELGGGMRLQYKRFGFSISHQLRTEEFQKQVDPHQYSSLVLFWMF